MDNLNTHSISSLYEAFPPEIARSLAKRLEIHYTPKHGSWLNIAEIELSVLSKQCLDRRIDSITILGSELTSWETVCFVKYFSLKSPSIFPEIAAGISRIIPTVKINPS
jgi:hypothetical protein